MVFTTLNKRIPCIPAVFFAQSKTFQKSPCRYETLHSLNYQHFDRFPPSFFLRVARNISFEVPLSREAQRKFFVFSARSAEKTFYLFARSAEKFFWSTSFARSAEKLFLLIRAKRGENFLFIRAKRGENFLRYLFRAKRREIFFAYPREARRKNFTYSREARRKFLFRSEPWAPPGPPWAPPQRSFARSAENFFAYPREARRKIFTYSREARRIFFFWNHKNSADQIATTGRPALRAGPT